MVTTDGTASFRFERKFRVPLHMVPMLPHILRSSSFGFREIYRERTINNIYFDTPLLRFFHENVQGVSERKKYRLRWYGSPEGLDRCRFEIKRKQGEVGRKDVVERVCFPSRLDAFTDIGLLGLPGEFGRETIGLFPTLFNRYKRRYFLSADGRYRATIDHDLHFGHPLSAEQAATRGHADIEAVLELKYDRAHDMDVTRLAVEFPFSLSKKSKYVNGIGVIYGC